MKRRIVEALESACVLGHWFTWRRPWLWICGPHICPLADLSDWLDQRWRTGVWERPLEISYGTFTATANPIKVDFTSNAPRRRHDR